MKKWLFALLSFVFLSAHGQTSEDVIRKYAANLGSTEAFDSIKTAKMTGTATAQGNNFPLTIQIINGKAVRTDIEVMGQQLINAYKEGKGWKQNAFAGAPTPTEVTGAELDELKQQSMIAPPLMHYADRGDQVELQGQEDVDGKKTFKIKMTSKVDSSVTYFYIDAADYMLIKSTADRKIMGQTMTVESWYSDLKAFGNVKFYMTRIQKVNGQEIQTIKLDSVELNVPVDESIFDMPK